MRRARWILIAFVLLATLAVPLLAQGAAIGATLAGGDPTSRGSAARIEGPPVLPGTIASTSVNVPVLAVSGKARARYHLTPYPGVRLFGDTTGVLDAAAGAPVIPVTYAVPRTQDVGTVSVARVVVEWSDGERWEAELEAQVQPRRGLRVIVRVNERGPAAPTYAVLRYLVTNVGNGTDTVEMRWDAGWNWRVQQSSGPMIITSGQTLDGTVNVEWPRGTAGGEMRVVQLTAVGRGSNTMGSIVVRVPFASSDALGFAEAPSTLFVGSSSNDTQGGSPSIALNSSTQLSPDTRVALSFRRQPKGAFSRVFAPEVGAQQFRLELKQPGFAGTLGTVYRPVTGLLGSVVQGEGAEADWNRGALHIGMLATHPIGLSFGNPPDEVLHTSADLETAFGSVGFTVTGLQHHDSVTRTTSEVREAGLRYSLGAAGGQRLSVEAGMLQLATPTGSTIGAAVDASYDGALGPAMLYGRIHRVPGIIESGEVLPTTASLGATLPVTSVVAVTASGSQATVGQIGQPVMHSGALVAGMSLNGLGASAQLLANLRRADAPFAAGAPSVGRSLSASVSIPVSAVALDGYSEIGTRTAGDTTMRTQLMRGGVRWSGDRGWLWAGVAYSHNEMPGADVHLETSGALTFGRAQWQFGASLNNAPASYFSTEQRTTTLPLNVGGYWSRVAYSATANTGVIVGAEYQPALPGTNRWRFSLGVQQSLDVRLPVHRAPVVSGDVFDDLNGNGKRDADEPGVAGVVVKMGEDRRQTTASGEYNFADWSLRGRGLDVDAASLPAGYMLPPDLRLASRGYVPIPLIHAAALMVVVHVMRADGSFTDEISAPDGLIVTISSKNGRVRDAAPVRGIATFDAALPGDYELRVIVPPAPGRAGPAPQLVHVTLTPGAKLRVDVGAPSTKREIRFGPSTDGAPATTSRPTQP